MLKEGFAMICRWSMKNLLSRRFQLYRARVPFSGRWALTWFWRGQFRGFVRKRFSSVSLRAVRHAYFRFAAGQRIPFFYAELKRPGRSSAPGSKSKDFFVIWMKFSGDQQQ